MDELWFPTPDIVHARNALAHLRLCEWRKVISENECARIRERIYQRYPELRPWTR